MTTVEITLPDQLAQQAQEAGLLSEPLEQWLRQQLRAQAMDQLRAAMDQIQSSPDPLPYMSPEEIAEEVSIVRAERWAKANTK